MCIRSQARDIPNHEGLTEKAEKLTTACKSHEKAADKAIIRGTVRRNFTSNSEGGMALLHPSRYAALCETWAEALAEKYSRKQNSTTQQKIKVEHLISIQVKEPLISLHRAASERRVT